MAAARLRLYDLAGAEACRRFSPNCWRTRLALAHKGLAVETVAWRFTDKAQIAFTGQGKVPVLVDGRHHVFDSWSIAEYLEDAYPRRASLFGGPTGHGVAAFFNQWATTMLHPAMARVIIPDIARILHPADIEYFRRTREAALGITLEELEQQQSESLDALHRVLKPLESTLQTQPYLCGDTPAYADHIAFGAFQWARVSSPTQVLPEHTGGIAAWRERMLDAYDGLGRRTPACGEPCA